MINNSPIDAYYGSRFSFVDWKGDGDPDILISGYYGFVEYYENVTVGVEEEGKNVHAMGVRITPNPVSKTAKISYSLTDPAQVEITVVASDGRVVARPVNAFLSGGRHETSWSVNGLPSGVYFVLVRADSKSETVRMVVVP